MAVFLLNICKFNKCGLEFGTLVDLIQHIEENHIGEFCGQGHLPIFSSPCSQQQKIILFRINMETPKYMFSNLPPHRLRSDIEARLSSIELRSALHHRCNAQREPTVLGQLWLGGVTGPYEQCQRACRGEAKDRHQASQLQYVVLEPKQYSNR